MERIITSSNGHDLLVEDVDYAMLSRWRWHVQHTGGPARYASAKIGSKRIYLHQLVMGTPPGPDAWACAIDRNLCNVAHTNLAWVNKSTVGHRALKPKRQLPGPTSEFRGVVWSARQQKWQASITLDGRRHPLGYFQGETEAAVAYDRTARKHFGAWACVNFPSPNDPPPPGIIFPPVPEFLRASDGASLHFDTEDAALLARHRWTPGPRSYETVLGTAVIPLPLLVLGPSPLGCWQWQFLDGDATNCTRANLAWVRVPSVRNQRANATRHRGEWFGVRETPGGRHSSALKSLGKVHYLGVFDTPEEAGNRYDDLAVEVFGPDAATNRNRLAGNRQMPKGEVNGTTAVVR